MLLLHRDLSLSIVYTTGTDLRYIRFDSSVGRGDFKTQIGVGRVIPGMSLISGFQLLRFLLLTS
jgi:hypothetical protein